MRPPFSDPLLFSADLAACRKLLQGGSRSFHFASLLLPSAVRAPATALYAFCREADDAVDLGPDSLAALAALRERLWRIYQGRPADCPADRAFAHVVAEYSIPRELPEALLEGFEWDATGRTYLSIAELNAYAARVAGVVGVMMSLLMHERRSAMLARASDLGVAMQLTNVARDVGEDARAGRLYLPVDWLVEAGIDPRGFLARPEFTPALGAVIRRVLAEADRLYQRAEPGIAALPSACRPGIRAARLLYAEIGREVERCGGDSVSTRAIVSGWRKVALLASASLAAGPAPATADQPALRETKFLVDAAVAAGHAPARAVNGLSAGAIERRVAWLIALFERLERSERASAVAVGAAAID
ncbi:MAG TPA: phytoene/squalene synthase family protein [Steroidobacteraceae bacterium]|nr:phytoene/squalene synthase family protein [Steroidobacteraceae bacterium]